MSLDLKMQSQLQEPLLITSAGFLRAVAKMDAAERTAVNFWGEKVQLHSMRVDQGFAVIPVCGVMGKNPSDLEKIYCGFVDTLDVLADIKEALADPAVKALVFDIDSPGGTVAGTAELADAIRASTKPTLAFGSGDICSAAYWTAVACDQVWASSSSSVGSIGVYMPFVDQSKRYEAAGYSVEMFTTGKYKGMGYPGTSLTDAQREHLQASVDALGSQFKAYVRSRRGEILDEDMQGQTFTAANAQARGLVDHVTADWTEWNGLP